MALRYGGGFAGEMVSSGTLNTSGITAAKAQEITNRSAIEKYVRKGITPRTPNNPDANTDIVSTAGLPIVGGIAAGAGLAVTIAQLLGFGEGGGLFDNNLLGGPATTIPGSDVILQGPGLAEPYPDMIAKEWNANGAQFYQLIDGRIAVYSKKRKAWKVYRPPKLAVIGKNMPSHQMLTRLRRNLKKHTDDAVTILKVTSPGKLRQYERVRTGPYRIRRK